MKYWLQHHPDFVDRTMGGILALFIIGGSLLAILMRHGEYILAVLAGAYFIGLYFLEVREWLWPGKGDGLPD